MKRLKIVFCTFLVLFICGCVYVPDVPGYFQEQLADVDEENKELDYLDCNLKYERCEIIQEEYGDSIVMYKDYDEFREKLQYYLENDDERKALAKKAQKITLEKFTNEVAAKKFIEIFKSIKK